MAKDPAFLFYPGDWLGGTMAFTFEEKGAYLELLILQYNQGTFTEAQAKHMLSTCSTNVWHNIKHKFVKEGDCYYQDRLKQEIEKRKAFSKSRRDNALGKKEVKAYAEHMEDEDVIEDKSKDDNNTGKEIFEKWNDFAVKNGLSVITVISPARRKGINARLQEKGFDFDKVLEEITKSDFTRGANERKWKIDFDWIFLSPNNFVKLLEGKYRNITVPKPKKLTMEDVDAMFGGATK